MHIDIDMVEKTLKNKFPVASMMLQSDDVDSLFVVFVLPELAVKVNDFLKKLIFEKAFGPETYGILKTHITGNGWVHTDHVHDPVSTTDWEYEELEAVDGFSGYSGKTWGRPKSLGSLPRKL